MADSKVTDMPAATSVNTADVLYLIQANTDKEISIATLLANLPNTITKLSGLLVLGGTPQTLLNSGTITTTQTLTAISNDASSALTINNGAYPGQIKVLICTSASATSTLTSNVGPGSIAFSRAGHTMLLVWYAGSWWPIGGTATYTF